MEKMIKVINDNLRNVISGIKEHREDLESSLETIKNDMSLKVKEANAYKSDVETARSIVSSLENEISDLERDLEELNSKFGAKNFKEILVAGNKEINAKIIEKKSLINEQGQIIIGLTDKARSLKDSLVELRERKIVTEDNLQKTKILESYYETRISDIIKFAEENPGDLADYKEEVPQEELNIQEDLDLSNVIDGSIFEEIDEISSGEPDQDLLKTVLANPQQISEYDGEETGENVEIEVSTTNQLENMISEAKSFVEKKVVSNNEPAPVYTIVEEKTEQVEEKEKVLEEPQKEEKNTFELPIVSEIEKVEEVKEEQPEAPEEDTENAIDIFVSDDSENEESINDFASDTEAVDPYLDLKGLQAELGLQETVQDTIDINIEDDAVEPINIDSELVASESSFVEESKGDFDTEIAKYGLNPKMFDREDLEVLQRTFNKDIATNFIQVMRKHKINLDALYGNGRILNNMTAENLDQVLSLLERTDALVEDLNLVFRYLDKVNVGKLEQLVMSGTDLSLTEVLGESIEYQNENNIGAILGLSKKAEEILKKTATETDYRIMNLLPDVVFENYREVRALKVDNLEDCISKYPHRFAMTHSKFHEILDRYDTEDLIRCINKNPAVIDKL